MSNRYASPRRLVALCRKETFQITRDPSSIIIAFVLPIVLLIIFGYGVNLDATRVRVGVLVEDGGSEASSLARTLAASPYLETRFAGSRASKISFIKASVNSGQLVVAVARVTLRIINGACCAI